MLTELQWKQVIDNLELIKSNIQKNIEDDMMADVKFNGDFADHVVEYLYRLAVRLRIKNKTCTNWGEVGL